MSSGAPSGDPLRALLRATHLLAPDQLATEVVATARRLGAVEAVAYLADYEQLLLLPLQGPGVPPRQELSIEGSLAGLAYRRVEVTRSPSHQGGVRTWLPLLDGVERLGVLEFVSREMTHELEAHARAFVSLVSELLVSNDAYSDLFARLRRRKTLSLAAEIQWDLLPPLTCATDRVVIAGALEPAYDIGGDTFDYAVNGTTVDLLVLDAVGHGLPAALLSSAAVGAYRHGRREGLDLPDISALVNQVLAGQFAGSQFATAVIARLDLDTGQLRWVNAGHPQPLLLRDGALLHLAACPPSRPLGLQDVKPEACETQLSPGDRLLFYTDGIVEARSPSGKFFGEKRLADCIIRGARAEAPPPETLRRLMRRVLAHQADQLQDDASIVLLEWRTGQENKLEL
ncbi:serine/threonine-protein phosphatase [Blastococcus sp. KM273128]|nr:serine/threonine-protein phosphatase [Blastococcus sp. KM273128]